MLPLHQRGIGAGYAPVGDQGVEPCTTALSERPLHRLSRRQRKTEVSSPAALRPPRVFRARCRAGGASSREESGGTDPQRSPAHPFSGRGLPPGRFTLHVGSRGWCTDRTSAGRHGPTSGFQPGTLPHGQPSRAEHEGLEPSTPDRRYALAGRCSSRCANAPSSTPGGARTLTPLSGHRFLGPARLLSATSA